MKKEMIRKSWPALALLQDSIWIIQNFNGKEIFHHFYDKVTDVRSSLHPKRKALAEEDLEPNLGQHWDSSRITLGSYSTSKAKNYLINSIE